MIDAKFIGHPITWRTINKRQLLNALMTHINIITKLSVNNPSLTFGCVRWHKISWRNFKDFRGMNNCTLILFNHLANNRCNNISIIIYHCVCWNVEVRKGVISLNTTPNVISEYHIPECKTLCPWMAGDSPPRKYGIAKSPILHDQWLSTNMLDDFKRPWLWIADSWILVMPWKWQMCLNRMQRICEYCWSDGRGVT